MKKWWQLSNWLYLQVLVLLWPVVYFWRLPGDDLVRGQYNRPELFVFDLLLIVALVWGFKKFQGAKQSSRLRQAVYVIAWALLLVSALGVYLANDKIILLAAVIRLFAAMAWYWLLVNFTNRRHLVISLAIAGSLASLLALGQFVVQQVPAAKWLGWSQQLPYQLGVSVVEHGSERWLRAYGPFAHPNILGGFVALVLLVVLNFLLTSLLKDRAERWLLFTLPLLVAGLLLSFSRAAVAAFCLGWLMRCLFDRWQWRRALILSTLLLVSALPWLLTGGYLWLGRTDLSNRLEQKSISQRQAYLVEAEELIAERPVLGWGLANYTVGLAKQHPSRALYDYQPVHNVFMLVRAELGYLGWFIFTALWLALFYYSWQTKIALAANFSLLTALSILVLSDHWLWSLHGGLMIFWLILAIMTQNTYGRQEQ